MIEKGMMEMEKTNKWEEMELEKAKAYATIELEREGEAHGDHGGVKDHVGRH
jgi:hypothetical protein